MWSPQRAIEVAPVPPSLLGVSLRHGCQGTHVLFSHSGPLRDAWRVAAYHSKDISELSSVSFNPETLEKADGIVVKGENFNHPLAISTADCLAVAMTLEDAQGIQSAACFHAGWRGYTAGIQQTVIEWMKIRSLKESPVNIQDILKKIYVTISPAIAGRQYPCGRDVEDAMCEHLELRLKNQPRWSIHHESAFSRALQHAEPKRAQAGKIYPDLQALMIIELHALGIDLNHISVLRDDTFSSDRWPSHRRAMSQGLPNAGRMVTHLMPASCPLVQNHVSNP